MSRRNQILLFWAILAAGAVLHVAVWLFKSGMHYPDEIFQYLEPAWVRLKGYGWLPWEFHRGVRNYSLIALYGGWMKLGLWAGLQGGQLHRLVGLHNTLLALAIVPPALRMGRLYGGEVGGWASAAVCAVLPPIMYFSPHPLSEVPSMVLSTWGLAFWLQGRTLDAAREPRYAFWAALLMGLSVVIRFFSAAYLVIPIVDYAVRGFRRNRVFVAFAYGGVITIGVLAFTDMATWGTPLHSAIEYFRYNILEWGNADHGVSPWYEYMMWMYERAGLALVIVVPLLAVGLWRAPLLSGVWILAFAVLCAISHKEERFLLGLWPLWVVCIAAGSAQLGAWVKKIPRLQLVATSLAAVALVAFTSVGVSKLDFHWYADLFAAQQYVGLRQDATGCMFSGRLHLSGGSVWLDRNVPMDTWQAKLAQNPLFNYFILQESSHEARRARVLGWTEMERFGPYIVYRR